MPRALITGITGQDGAYLAKRLLERGYDVFGTTRAGAPPPSHRLERLKIADRVTVLPVDLLSEAAVARAFDEVDPTHVFNLAAPSHVGDSFTSPAATAEFTTLSVIRLLAECHRRSGTRFYQASTGEMFAPGDGSRKDELASFRPSSPYGSAKLFAHWTTVNYRELYGVHACSGILFNHESPLRSPSFVTRKIAIAVAKQAAGDTAPLLLGNLDAKRDWGHAREYVDAMIHMVERETPNDFVIATGDAHAVREFVELAFGRVGIQLRWSGTGVNEKGFDASTGALRVGISPQFFRPVDPPVLVGDPRRAKSELGWAAATSFSDLVGHMVDFELGRVEP